MGSVPAATATVREIWRAQRADGPAAVLAIGTANPEKFVPQDEFPDFFFRATNSDHLTALKDKFKRVCKHGTSSPARGHLSFRPCRRSFLLASYQYLCSMYVCPLLVVTCEITSHRSEARRSETLPAPHGGVAPRPPRVHRPRVHDSPSLDARLDIVATAVPELAAQASKKAIAEWGRPATDITHLVVTTNSGAHIPGVDFRLIPLLGLRPSVRRTMLYLNGCFAGSAALRLAKDLAENNRGARVLVVCAELTLMLFSGPKEGYFQTLVNQGLFGDGAGTVIVGADQASPGERPLFEMVSAAQTVVPDSDHAITMHLTKGGYGGYGGNISTREVPGFIGDNIEQCLQDSFGPLGIAAKWNDLFWAVHPGSSAILDHIDTVLKLQPEKLAASRRVLSEYGNMFGVTIFFVLDELRRRRKEQHQQGDWGVMMTFGPGLTVETMVLHATQHTQASV